MSSVSVTEWLLHLKAGDPEAAQKLYERYFERLVRLAHKRLCGIPRGGADEEDVAQNAFKSFWRGVQRGKFPRLNDRDDLWRILFTIVKHQVFDLRKREPDPPGPLPPENLMPTDGQVVKIADGVTHLIGRLDDPQLREIAIWKMEGYTNDEIAAKLCCVTRTIERKLRLIRKIWQDYER